MTPEEQDYLTQKTAQKEAEMWFIGIFMIGAFIWALFHPVEIWNWIFQ